MSQWLDLGVELELGEELELELRLELGEELGVGVVKVSVQQIFPYSSS